MIITKTVLFQGDSVTECGRNHDSLENIGAGYPYLVKALLDCDYPTSFLFKNRGISGNRIVDLYARIKSDIINLEPDYISILIGVNDVWHELGSRNGVSAEKFEKIYGMLIEEIKEALPETKIMIMEPFCLHGPSTDDCESIPNKWQLFRSGVEERAEISKKIAERYGLLFVPLQSVFDSAAEKVTSTRWLFDGVHPTAMGHELIKREWIKNFKILRGEK